MTLDGVHRVLLTQFPGLTRALRNGDISLTSFVDWLHKELEEKDRVSEANRRMTMELATANAQIRRAMDLFKAFTEMAGSVDDGPADELIEVRVPRSVIKQVQDVGLPVLVEEAFARNEYSAEIFSSGHLYSGSWEEDGVEQR